MENNLQEMVNGGIQAVLKPKKEPRPCHVNRCSQLGHPCERYLYYCRTAWNHAGERSDALQGTFNTGNVLEPVIGRIVSEIGAASDPPWRIVGQETTTRDSLLEKYKISGRIDGFLQVDQPITTSFGGETRQWETVGVVDIKTSSPNIFHSLDGTESLQKYPWTKRYRAQLSLYALAHDLEQCILLFVNKANLWQMKAISFPLDLEYAESLLKKAERINKAVEAGEPPEKLNHPDECNRCEFAHICVPELISTGNLEISTDAELEELLIRRQEVAEARAEYEGIERRLKKMLVKGQDLACGGFIIKWTQSERKEFLVKAGTVWRKKILTTSN